MILLEKKRLEMHEDFAKCFGRTTDVLRLPAIALDWRVAHEVPYILPNHKDPANRFLAATAIAYDLILVTADPKLMQVPGLRVLANI